MTMEKKRDKDPNELPPKLVEALRRSQAKRVFVPPTVDEAILKAARAALEGKKQKPRWYYFRLWSPTVGAACFVALLMIFRMTRPHNTFAREDVNRDGVVDILDAFQVARAVQDGKPAPVDFNGDGKIDQRDAEAIATHAVSLEKGGRS